MTVRIGSQTPSKSVIISDNNSKYKEAVELYEKSGRKCYEWQQNILKPILAQNEEGLWTHTTFGYSVPRQNGKNEVVAIRELYGLEKGENILHTAHRTQTSTSAWNRLCQIIEEAGYKEEEDYKKWAQKGLEKIEFFESGGVIHFRTRTTTGGLGESFDVLIIDEAQEYTDDQQSAIKYTIAASNNPQTIMTGTPPTLVSSGTVFTNFRDKSLQGENFNSGWCEWSIDEISDCYDQELWYRTNPSLGLRINLRTIQDEVGDDEVDFNIQRLGLWLKYNQKSAISEKDWERCKVKSIPVFKSKLHIGIKYSKDGTNVALSIAVKTHSDRIFIESIDCQAVRNGNLWIISFLKQIDAESIVIDGAGGQNLLSEELNYQKVKPKPILPKVDEVISANFKFTQAIYQDEILHNDQPSLTSVITNCEKRAIGSKGGFGYKSQYDDREIALMDSAILAYWSCAEIKQKSKQTISY